VSLDTNPR